jgi:hypothetical protein
MNPALVIRQAKLEDYPAFLLAEKQAWGKDTDVHLITRVQFETWLQVFPEGLWLAEHRGQICGHLFSQICNFDPTNESDNRTWDEITNFGFAASTHNPDGFTMYTVSVSAHFPGAGKRLLRKALDYTRQHNLRFYAGASSIPGVSEYAQGRAITRELVEEYVAGVLRKLGHRLDTGPRIVDPVVSVTLSVEGARFYRLLENYFDYPKSGNWAVLIAYENSNYKALR